MCEWTMTCTCCLFLCMSVINICKGACLRICSVNVGMSVYVCVV